MTDISKDKLLQVAPSVLVNDSGMNPLVEVLAETLAALSAKSRLPTLYNRIDELPEAILDTLANDFKVRWYDFNYDVETKRKVLRDSFFVHRHMGTTQAVKVALENVWPGSNIEEWYEYGGDPFYFRVVTTTEWTPEMEQTMREKIEIFKNARSVLDTIYFNSGGVEIDLNTAAAVCGIDVADAAVTI